MRTKRAPQAKQKVFFSIFKWLSVTTSCVRPESAPLSLTKINSVQQRILIFSKPFFPNIYKQLHFCNASVALINQKKKKKKHIIESVKVFRFEKPRHILMLFWNFVIQNSVLCYTCEDSNFSDYMMFCVWVWNIFKMSWRHVMNTSCGHVLKMSWRHVLKTF